MDCESILEVIWANPLLRRDYLGLNCFPEAFVGGPSIDPFTPRRALSIHHTRPAKCPKKVNPAHFAPGYPSYRGGGWDARRSSFQTKRPIPKPLPSPGQSLNNWGIKETSPICFSRLTFSLFRCPKDITSCPLRRDLAKALNSSFSLL